MNTLKSMYHNVINDAFPDTITMNFGNEQLTYKRRFWNIEGEEKGLRYGENPDQPAAMYELIQGTPTVGGFRFRGAGEGLVSAITEDMMLQAGKHPGKTNFTDIDNGINILQYLTKKAAAVILKHNNPCGAAWSDESITDALSKAFWCDRIAAFGGAIVVNRAIDEDTASFINDSYFEVIAAPSYEEKALAILRQKKNLRIIALPSLSHLEDIVGVPFLDITSLQDGGLIFQQSFINRIHKEEDFLPATAESNSAFLSARKPTKNEAEDLIFAWAVESGVTSNSVIFAKNGVTTAIGTGEQDRVGCVELAITKAYSKYADALAFQKTGLSLYELTAKAASDTKYAELLQQITSHTHAAKGGLMGSVLVSDGFFPYRDGVDTAIAQGITAIAQPGGSLRDGECIMACNEASPQVGMVFTGQRSFKH